MLGPLQRIFARGPAPEADELPPELSAACLAAAIFWRASGERADTPIVVMRGCGSWHWEAASHAAERIGRAWNASPVQARRAARMLQDRIAASARAPGPLAEGPQRRNWIFDLDRTQPWRQGL